MGQSSSSARRRRRYTTDFSSTTTSNNYSSSSFPPPPPLNQPPPPPPPPSSSNYPYYTPNPYNYPPPNPNYYYSNPNSYPPPSYQHQLTQTVNSVVTFIESLITSTTSSGTGSRPNNNFYHNNYGPPSNQFGGPWVSSQTPLGPPPPPPPPMQQHQPPPQFVESQNAKTVKNEVNVHKDTIRFTSDESNDHHLLTFTFDASVDGSITVYYFAQEGEGNCIFSTAYPDIYKPTKFSFQKGAGQIFSQPSGSGINLSFFTLEDLSKPLKENIFPLVICIKNEEATCAQITEAIIEKTISGSFQPKVKKQILLVNGERYELQEIYGLADSEGQADSIDDGDDDDRGKECVICLSEPRNTAVFPCRHMCMCSDCAKALRTQSNKCPICRQPVEKLMEINVNKGNR